MYDKCNPRPLYSVISKYIWTSPNYVRNTHNLNYLPITSRHFYNATDKTWLLSVKLDSFQRDLIHSNETRFLSPRPVDLYSPINPSLIYLRSPILTWNIHDTTAFNPMNWTWLLELLSTLQKNSQPVHLVISSLSLDLFHLQKLPTDQFSKHSG